MKDLLNQRKVDSINSITFQRYLKDSFGIERQGNKPVKVVYNTNNYFSKQSGPKELPDSLNFYVKLQKSDLYIAPKEGAWVRPFFATDTANNSKNTNIVHEGMGPMQPPDKVSINRKTYIVGTYLIYERAVYMQKPLTLNISGNMNQYIIFGDQGNSNKRYLYKQGKVQWIPGR